MREYTFKIYDNHTFITTFMFAGSNAIDAYESALEAGNWIPVGIILQVVAINERGVGIRFESGILEE